MSPKGRGRLSHPHEEGAEIAPPTPRASRRYAVEEAIARARSGQPWYEVSVSPSPAMTPPRHRETGEEVDVSIEETPGEEELEED